jgi:thymidylate synthase (FAD)
VNVKLIGITKPLGEYKDLSPEEFIIAQARISNPENKLNRETMPKLLSYLIKNKHWSPLDLVSLNFEIETSRDIGTQLLRHWNVDWQEYSQRYSEIMSIEPIEFRKQGKTNRQVGDEEFDSEVPDTYGLFEGHPVKANQMKDMVLAIVQGFYQDLIKAGVAKECARRIMPLASTTNLIGHGTVRSWMSVLNQRLDDHAQKEIREVANRVGYFMIKEFPNLAETTNNFNDLKGNFM